MTLNHEIRDEPFNGQNVLRKQTVAINDGDVPCPLIKRSPVCLKIVERFVR